MTASLGVRVIAADRPGGGGSSPQKGRKMVDWGFRPEDITHHVELFYGDNDDMLDPEMPLHLASRLPDCTTHIWPGTGHYGFVDRDRWAQFFQAVA